MYSIEYTDEYMAEFVDNIQKAIAEMKLAVGLLVDKKLSHMRIHSINIKEFETNCDGIYVNQLSISLTVKQTQSH